MSFQNFSLPLQRQNISLILLTFIFTIKDMAIAIREIPVLTGQDAQEFIRNLEQNANKPVPRLTEDQERLLEQVKLRSKTIVKQLGL